MKNSTKLILILMLALSQVQAGKIYATFTVEAYRQASIAFSAGGVIKELKTGVAMQVGKGEVLASLNNNDLKAKLKIAIIAMQHAKSEYERQLSVKEVIQQAKLDSYKFQYDNTKAQIDYLQALLERPYLRLLLTG